MHNKDTEESIDIEHANPSKNDNDVSAEKVVSDRWKHIILKVVIFGSIPILILTLSIPAYFVYTNDIGKNYFIIDTDYHAMCISMD